MGQHTKMRPAACMRAVCRLLMAALKLREDVRAARLRPGKPGHATARANDQKQPVADDAMQEAHTLGLYESRTPTCASHTTHHVRSIVCTRLLPQSAAHHHYCSCSRGDCNPTQQQHTAQLPHRHCSCQQPEGKPLVPLTKQPDTQSSKLGVFAQKGKLQNSTKQALRQPLPAVPPSSPA